MPEKKTDDSKDKYDNAAKIVFQERPMDVIQFATGYTSPTIEPLKASLEIRKKREVDTLAKIKIPSEKNPKRLIYAIAHVEFQAEPVPIMPYRMAEFRSVTAERLEIWATRCCSPAHTSDPPTLPHLCPSHAG